jgi:molybdopterin/thiamine biosynthesis adenylyltransferase
MVRAADDLAAGPHRLFFSTWDWLHVTSLAAGRPDASALSTLYRTGVTDFTLVGVGAVGCAVLLTLWASAVPLAGARLVDADRISPTNLNRYVLFGFHDLSHFKALRATDLLTRSSPPFQTRAVTEWWADYRRGDARPVDRLVSAVDTNHVRHQLQDALPRLIYGASTLGMRARVDRYDLGDSGSNCLKCHNRVEVLEADAELRLRLLQLDSEALMLEAVDRGVDAERLACYVEDLRAGGDGCAILAGHDLDKLRRGSGESVFAVSFVSSMAGTLLAAQWLREMAGCEPVLKTGHSKGTFQLWRPAADGNAARLVTPDPDCWCRRPQVRAAYASTWRGQQLRRDSAGIRESAGGG